MSKFQWSGVLVLLILFMLPEGVLAANVFVNCPNGGPGTYSSITAALNAIGQTGPSVITVSGNCAENVSLYNAVSITIIGAAGATLDEPTDNDAVDVALSRDIWLINLDIRTTGPDGAGVNVTDGSEVHIIRCNVHDNQTVGVNVDTSSDLFLNHSTIQHNSPGDGLDVYDESKATVGNTLIQNNGSSGNGIGMFVSRNSVAVINGASAVLNNADIGIQVHDLSNVIFGAGSASVEGHQVDGLIVDEGSHVQANGFVLVQGNGGGCVADPSCGGILARQNATVLLSTGAVNGNSGSGIDASEGSNVKIGGVSITNNSGDGLRLEWLSIGDIQGGNTISGNGGSSVLCRGRSLAVGNLSGFANVQCGDVEQSDGKEHSHAEK